MAPWRHRLAAALLEEGGKARRFSVPNRNVGEGCEEIEALAVTSKKKSTDVPFFFNMGCFQKIVGLIPQNHPLKNRVFHYLNHPFWGTLIFGNTHMLFFWFTCSHCCYIYNSNFFLDGHFFCG